MTIMATMPAIKCSAQSKVPVSYKAKVTEVLPHDVNAYTQGLFFHEGRLYESSGQYGQSYFREVDLARGTTVRSFNLAAKYFAEGAVVFKDRLYLLTWMERDSQRRMGLDNRRKATYRKRWVGISLFS